MKTIYIVRYSTGSYSDYREINIFATTVKSKAIKYVTRFNKILNDLQENNKRFEDKSSYNWIKDEYSDYYMRWYQVRETNRAFWEQIEIR